jgi:hypothetical protein
MKDIPVEWFVKLSQVWYSYCIIILRVLFIELVLI